MNKYDEMEKRDREDDEALGLVEKRNRENVETFEGIPFRRFNENGYTSVNGGMEFGKVIDVEIPKKEEPKKEETRKEETKPQHLKTSKPKNNLPIHPKNLNISPNVLVMRTGMVLAPLAIAVSVLSGLSKRIDEKIEASRKEPTTIAEVVEELDPDYLSKYFVIVNSTDPSTDVLLDQVTNGLAQMGVEVRGLHSDNELMDELVNEEAMCHFKRTTVMTLESKKGNNSHVVVGVDEKTSTSDVLALNCMDAIEESDDLTAGVRIGKVSITPHSNDPLMSENETKRLTNYKAAYLTLGVSEGIISDAEKTNQLVGAIVSGFDNYARTPKKLQGKDCIHEVKWNDSIESLANFYGCSEKEFRAMNSLDKDEKLETGDTVITMQTPTPLEKTVTNTL